MSTHGMSEASALYCSGGRVACVQKRCSRHSSLYRRRSAVQSLSWRGFAVRKNFSYRRCKVIDTRAGDYDAVTPAVSFFGDPQESTALIFAELDIEVLALNLQFSRLDDVVHFALRAPSLGSGTLEWKKNSQVFIGSGKAVPATGRGRSRSVALTSILQLTVIRVHDDAGSVIDTREQTGEFKESGEGAESGVV